MILVILVIVTRSARLLPRRLSGLAEKQSLDTHVDDINTGGHQHHGQADQHTHRPDTPDSLRCNASPRRQDSVWVGAAFEKQIIVAFLDNAIIQPDGSVVQEYVLTEEPAELWAVILTVYLVLGWRSWITNICLEVGWTSTLLETRCQDSLFLRLREACYFEWADDAIHYQYSITNDDMGQFPSDQVWRLRPIQVVLRARRSVWAGPAGRVPRVVLLTISECFPAPRLLTASMYTSYSVPHLAKKWQLVWLNWCRLFIILLEVLDEFPPGFMACLQHFPSIKLFSVKYLVRGDWAASIQMIWPLHCQRVWVFCCHSWCWRWWGNWTQK